MQAKILPPGFITVEEAVELINSDTRTNPTVNVDAMLESLPFLRIEGNFNIMKMKTDPNTGYAVPAGSTYVQIETEWDRAQIEHAIIAKKKEATGIEVDPMTIGVTNMTTAVDDEKNPSGKFKVNDQPLTKVGEVTAGGSEKEN